MQMTLRTLGPQSGKATFTVGTSVTSAPVLGGGRRLEGCGPAAPAFAVPPAAWKPPVSGKRKHPAALSRSSVRFQRTAGLAQKQLAERLKAISSVQVGFSPQKPCEAQTAWSASVPGVSGACMALGSSRALLFLKEQQKDSFKNRALQIEAAKPEP